MIVALIIIGALALALIELGTYDIVGKRLRVQHRRSRVSATGKHAFSIGLRLGYWPCLGGPFVALDLGTHRLEAWYGRESYRKEAIG